MPNDDIAPESRVRSLALLLTDGFSLMSYASIIEPFRAANTLAGRTLYRWRHVSPDGGAVAASNGASILADRAVGETLDCDRLFVFAGGDPATFDDARTFAWLRAFGRTGAAIAGVSGGPFLLARAGLLEGYRATIHWDHAAAFREAFPVLALDSSLYVIDRRRMTCAGGTAGLDLAIELIEREQGARLARQVSDWFIRTDARRAERPQRASLRERHGTGDDRVLRALAEMEAWIEEPRPRAAIAATAGLSLRQIERRFEAAFGRSMASVYLAIRLDMAAHLLRSTGMSVTDVGLACGFRSSSHFSRRFKARFGAPPSGRPRAAIA